MTLGETAGKTLGPFAVATDAAALARFSAVAGAASMEVPTTFPIVWLSHPELRAAILKFARPGEVAFHEEQTFDYRAPLVPEATYALTALIERVEEPARIILASEVVRDGATILAMRTVLRLIATGALATTPASTQAVQQ